MSYNYNEKYYTLPIMLYWGFFKNVLELPRLLSIDYSFRLNKREYLFIVTFLIFFFKCFFLDEKIKIKIHYSNLFFEVKMNKKQKNFIFFFYFFKLFSFFNIYNIKINKSAYLVGKRNYGYFILSTTKMFFFISEVCSNLFFNNWNNSLFNHIYILFQNIFYSSKGISLNLNIMIKFFLKNNDPKYFLKVLRLYSTI